MQNSRITPLVPGAGRLMITDHGTHPPELWAQATAEQLLSFGPSVTGARLRAARVLQSKIEEALEVHHKTINDEELTALSADDSHHERSANPEHNIDRANQALLDIVALAQGTEWAEVFNDPDSQAKMHFELARMFASHQDVERSHFRTNKKGGN